MLMLSPSTPIFLVHKPVDFRKGIEGLSGVAEEILQLNPYSGGVIIFRNKRGHSTKMLYYDGTGMWLCMKRLAKGSFKHWPVSNETLSVLKAQELSVLLFNGNPWASNFQADWNPVTLPK